MPFSELELAKATLQLANYCEIHLIPLKHYGGGLVCPDCRRGDQMNNKVRVDEAIETLKKYRKDSSGN